jgi:hypothetical protein
MSSRLCCAYICLRSASARGTEVDDAVFELKMESRSWGEVIFKP